MFILPNSIVSYSIYHSCIQCIVYSVRLSFLCVAPPEHVALQFCHFCGSLRTWKSSSTRVKRKHKGQKSRTSKHIVALCHFCKKTRSFDLQNKPKSKHKMDTPKRQVRRSPALSTGRKRQLNALKLAVSDQERRLCHSEPKNSLRSFLETVWLLKCLLICYKREKTWC